MITSIKRFFRRREARAVTDRALARWEFDGIFVGKGVLGCWGCGERVVELQRRYERCTLSGEKLTFHEHVAYACRRCQTVSPAADCSTNRVHVSEWVPAPKG